MPEKETSHQRKLRIWMDRISDRIRSGLTVKAWCTKNGINYRVYHYWLKRVREYAEQFMPEATSKSEVSVSGRQQESEPPQGCVLAEAKEMKQATVNPSITIEIGGCRVMVRPETDEGLMLKVCQALITIC
jgi:putative transposase